MTALNTLLTRKRDLYPDIDIDRIAQLIRNEYFNTIYRAEVRSDFNALSWVLERGISLVEFEHPEKMWSTIGICPAPSYRVVTDYEYHSGVFTNLEFLKANPQYAIVDVFGKLMFYSPQQSSMVLVKGFMWGYLAPGLHARIISELKGQSNTASIRDIVSDMTEILNSQQSEERSLRSQFLGRIA